MRTGTRQTIVSIPGRAQVCFHTDGPAEGGLRREHLSYLHARRYALEVAL